MLFFGTIVWHWPKFKCKLLTMSTSEIQCSGHKAIESIWSSRETVLTVGITVETVLPKVIVFCISSRTEDLFNVDSAELKVPPVRREARMRSQTVFLSQENCKSIELAHRNAARSPCLPSKHQSCTAGHGRTSVMDNSRSHSTGTLSGS